jgi:hypothetical protein
MKLHFISGLPRSGSTLLSACRRLSGSNGSNGLPAGGAEDEPKRWFCSAAADEFVRRMVLPFCLGL